jgi:hypothetical protein
VSTFLRSRYRALHNRFGTAGVILGVIALVLALGGTALAAKGALTGKQRKEVEKIAKKYAGKPGAPGTVGTNGTNGTNGKDGTNGAPGKDGEDGTDGTGATATAFTGSKGTCTQGQGGVEVKSAGATTTYVCNGEEGEAGDPGAPGDPGPEGSPWTDGGTLPPGEMETGSWSYAATPADTAGVHVPLSFPIPLDGPLEGHAHFQFDEDFFTFCEGGAEFPKPKAGELCVYASNAETPDLEKITFEGIFSSSFEEIGASPQGAVLKFSTPTENSTGGGTFAVRAPLVP